MAREHTVEFAAYIGQKQSAEVQKEIRRLSKELSVMEKRSAELDAIFKRLYEDNVLGNISAEQFQMLSGSYTEERNLDHRNPRKGGRHSKATGFGIQHGQLYLQSKTLHRHY